MKKHIAKALRKAAQESLEFGTKEEIKKRYKKFKKAWRDNKK